jgi:hypothetical protein
LNQLPDLIIVELIAPYACLARLEANRSLPTVDGDAILSLVFDGLLCGNKELTHAEMLDQVVQDVAYTQGLDDPRDGQVLDQNTVGLLMCIVSSVLTTLIETGLIKCIDSDYYYLKRLGGNSAILRRSHR